MKLERGFPPGFGCRRSFSGAFLIKQNGNTDFFKLVPLLHCYHFLLVIGKGWE